MAETIDELLRESVRKHAGRPAVVGKVDGEYVPLTYAELDAKARQFGSGLAALGVKRGDTVGLISENRPEWAIVDLGTLAIGAVNVPVFTTLPPPQIEYIMRDSGAEWLVVSDAKQLEKSQAVRVGLPHLRLIAMDGASDEGVVSLAEVMALGEQNPLSEEAWEALDRELGPDSLATIVYTSGTTGDPKGVLLTHGNITANVASCQEVLHFEPTDVLLSFLPLNHAFERTAGHFLPLSCGAQIAYVESLRRMRQNMQEVRPTYMILVPRVYEAFEEALKDRVSEASALRRGLFGWALSVGEARTDCEQAGRRPAGMLRLRSRVADKLVFGRAREAMGLDRLKSFVSGGAALPPATAHFFFAAGMPIIEGYGMTEAAPVITVNRPGQARLGTVGPAMPGVEVRLGEEGEVICRGPNVMAGYHNKPEATAEAIDEDGWLHTGDVGEIDEDGFLRITDRLKDLIVLTNGKKVAPQPIESHLKRSPYIAQIVLFGDGHEVVSAIVVPDLERVRQWAQEQGLELPEEPSELTATDEVRELIRTEIDALSEGLAHYEKIRGIALLDSEMTPESGELTPTLKVKRRVVVERYGHLA